MIEGTNDSSRPGSRSFVRKRSVDPRTYSVGCIRLFRNALLISGNEIARNTDGTTHIREDIPDKDHLGKKLSCGVVLASDLPVEHEEFL